MLLPTGCPIIDRVFLSAASIASALLCVLRFYEGLPEPSARNLPAKSEYQKRAWLQGGVFPPKRRGQKRHATMLSS